MPLSEAEVTEKHLVTFFQQVERLVCLCQFSCSTRPVYVSSLVPQTTGFTLKIRRGSFHLEVFLTASIEWSIRTCLPGKAMKSLSFWVFENNGLSWLKRNLDPVRSLSLKEMPVWGFFGCPYSCVELGIAQKKANTLNVQSVHSHSRWSFAR